MLNGAPVPQTQLAPVTVPFAGLAVESITVVLPPSFKPQRATRFGAVGIC